jgi:transposase
METVVSSDGPADVCAPNAFHWAWRIPDALWDQFALLIPKPVDHHPLGCHRKRVDNRAALDGIFFVLRTGCQWNALNATGICSSSSAHRRFLEWSEAGVFEQFWIQGLLEYDQLQGIDWSWLSMDGAMTKAPLGGEKGRPQSLRSRQRRRETQPADRSQRHSSGPQR